jgi:ribosome-binding protein aMBF1 (putative translation factor)
VRAAFRLSDAEVRMAVDLGMSPEDLRVYVKRRLKKRMPRLGLFLASRYRNTFGKEPPDSAPSLEAERELKARLATDRKVARPSEASLRKPKPKGDPERAVYAEAVRMIEEARVAAGLSPEELADRMGYTALAIHKLLDPKRSRPNLANLSRVAKALNLSFEFRFAVRQDLLPAEDEESE